MMYCITIKHKTLTYALYYNNISICVIFINRLVLDSFTKNHRNSQKFDDLRQNFDNLTHIGGI